MTYNPKKDQPAASGKAGLGSDKHTEGGGDANIYDDDMAKTAVGRLFSKDGEPGAESEKSDMEYVDYINSTSKLSHDERERRREGAVGTLRSAARGTAKKRDDSALPAASGEFFGDDGATRGGTGDKGDDGIFTLSMAKFGMAVAVFLIVLVFLIVRVNSLDSQLKAAQKTIEGQDDYVRENQALIIQNDELNSKVKELETRNQELLNDLQTALSGTQSGGDTNVATSGGSTSTSQTNTTASPTPIPTPTIRRHTVAKSESLWSIAAKYYGDGSKYTAIMEANNIRDEKSLQEGQVLIIP